MDPLIDATYRQRLGPVSLAADGATAARAAATCRRIESDLAAVIAELRPVLDEVGVECVDDDGARPRQNHTIGIRVGDHAVAERAVGALEAHGFTRWERWRGGALESFRRSADQMTVARTDDHTTVVRFRWQPRRERSRVDRAVTPTSGDWSIVTLPTWAWRAYPLIRLGRLAAERLGLRARHHASLGPYLATPAALVDELLDHAAVGPDDVVVDLGCGDGRLVVEAAERRGCRAVGVEHDDGLIDAARRRAAASPAVDRVRFVRGDARTVDVSDATVVLMFLPIDVVADIVDDVLDRLQPGARVVVHEQSRLPPALRPDDSRLLLGDNAVTVAHTWRAT